MSWRVEVIADDSGEWAGNSVYFETEAEADAYGADLASRWMLVRRWRTVPSAQPANYRWVNGFPEDIR